MTLKDLVGSHELTGCDMETVGDATAICFALDGVIYRAQEDPGDGYRSYLGEFDVTTTPLKNTFTAVKVVGKLSGDEEILELIDAENGKTVLEVGTSNADDYYPSFVGNFTPENMAVNA